ncbi:hypothetical protein AAEX28_05185 [Lentisphaerota bacterium WC36G]|nr:hypothetical protein LJT99_08040 [Lentisphaerae bacterium WC36]
MKYEILSGFLLLTSGILYVTKYISAAIFMSGRTTWSPRIYDYSLQCIGYNLNIASVIALIAGLFLFFLSIPPKK